MRAECVRHRSACEVASEPIVFGFGCWGFRRALRSARGLLRRPRFVWLWLLVVPLSGACHLSIAGQERERGASQTQLHWRDSLACGQTSCYVFLKLCGAPNSLDSVRSAIPIVPGKGTNLAEMARGCKQLGLDVDIVRSAPSELDHASLPVIAHLTYPIEKERGNAASSELVGHFVVVVGIDDHTIDLIDASSSVGASPLVRMTRGAFSREWTGELLVRHIDRSNKWSTVLGLLLGGSTIVALVALWFVRRRNVGGSFELGTIPQQCA